MKRFTMNSTSVAALGVLVAALSGCANEEAITAEEQEDTSAPQQKSEAMIVAAAPIIDGCNATQVVDIRSAQNINQVALDRSALNQASAQYQAFDEFGRQISATDQLIEASAAFQAVLDEAASSVNAFAASQRFAREDVSHQATASVVETVQHSDAMAAHRHAASTRTSQAAAASERVNQASAVNEAVANDSAVANHGAAASQFANGANNAVATQGGSSAVGVGGPWLWGVGGGVMGGFVSQGTFNGFSSATQVAEHSAVASNRHVASAASQFLRAADVASRHDFASATAAESSDVAASNFVARTTTAATADALHRTTQVADQASRAESAAAHRAARAETQAQRNRALTAANLEHVASRHVVLTVQFSANSVNELMRVFAGASAAQSASALSRQDISVGFPGFCGGVLY